jgi:small-conductance mechanosensitive channel
MNDVWIRQPLIEELQIEVVQSASLSADEEDHGFLAGSIETMKRRILAVRERGRVFLAGVRDESNDIPSVLNRITEGKGAGEFLRIVAKMMMVFGISLAMEMLFRRWTHPSRKRMETGSPEGWMEKGWRLAMRTLLDAGAISVFSATALAAFWVVDERNPSYQMLAVTYLLAFLIVRTISFISRILLAPGASSLRFMPLDDDGASYIHKWVVRIAIVGGFGWLTCGLFRLFRVGEPTHLLMVAAIGLIVALMLLFMIIQKRHPVAQIIRKQGSAVRLRAQIADSWHLLAIVYVLLLWALWVVGLITSGTQAVLPAIVSILSVPLFLILDWFMQNLLNVAFATRKVSRPGKTLTPLIPPDIREDKAEPRGRIEGLAGSEPEAARTLPRSGRLRVGIGLSLRVLLAVFFVFWVIGLWANELEFTKKIAGSALSVLMAMLACYVAWEFANDAILRKLQAGMPDLEDEMEAGGKGGSRIATLLLLLRKFLLASLIVIIVLITLATIGVNIGPMIAGAGVIGLAVGFGSQTLVRDIISGIFFLISDAFRIGDYVATGTAKGTVEQISIRSIKLRHPRGMVYTIPFGDMKQVTNFSRDYIITKLDIRVSYDTDLDKIRKIIKNINKELKQDKAIEQVLLDDIKSQGVREMDDSAMILRVKFKTLPGEQFVIRREVYQRIQQAFKENGIEFAHRNVTVYLPPEASEKVPEDGSVENKGFATRKGNALLQAGAAAALSATQGENGENA